MAAPTATVFPPSQAGAIDAALRALPAQRGLDADTRKQAEDLLRQAQADEAHADELAQQWQSLGQTAAGADTEAQKIEESLAADSSEAMAKWRAALPERATAEQLEALLDRERGAATDARAAVTALESELARQTTRPAQLRDELAAAHATLDSSQAALSATNKSGPPALAQAQRLRAQTAQRLATIRIALLNLENRSYEPRMRLLSAQLRERQRASLLAGQRASTLENLLLDRTGAQVHALQARAAEERAALDPRARPAGEISGFEVRPHLCHQIEEEMQVMDREQRPAQHLARHREVPQIRPREVGGVIPGARFAFAPGHDRPRVLPELFVAQVQRAIGRELRRMYDDVAQEPIPDDFMDLLRKIDEAEGSKGGKKVS